MKLVEITLTLHPSQRMGWNKWNCTIDGEQRIVTSDKVQFVAKDFEDMSKHFDTKECVDIKISWNRSAGIDARGNPIYYD